MEQEVKEIKNKYNFSEHLLSFENEFFKMYCFNKGIVGKSKIDDTTIIKNGDKGQLYSKYSIEAFFNDLGHYSLIDANFTSDKITLEDSLRDAFMEEYL